MTQLRMYIDGISSRLSKRAGKNLDVREKRAKMSAAGQSSGFVTPSTLDAATVARSLGSFLNDGVEVVSA